MTNNTTRTAHADRPFLWTVILIAMLASSVPYLVGLQHARETDDAYLALSPFSPADTNVYYSYIEQARAGRILFLNTFTTDAQDARLVGPLWLLIGWLGAVTRLATPVVYHLARLAMIAVFLWFANRFLAACFPARMWRRIGLLVLAFSSGIGAIVEGAQGNPILYARGEALSADLWISEGNTFLSFMHSPLFTLSHLALLGVFLLFLKSTRIDRSLWTAAGIVLLLSVGHTYDLLIIGAVLAGFFFVQILTNGFSKTEDGGRYLGRLFLLFLPSLLGVGYFLWVLATDPAVSGWVKQNVTLSPGIVYYLTGYGFLLPLAALGAVGLVRSRHRLGLLCLTWAVVAFLLLYVPWIPVQRRLANGIHIPLAVLATFGIQAWFDWVRRAITHRWRALLRFASVLLLVGGLGWTNVAVTISAAQDVQKGSVRYYPPYVKDDFVDAARWLQAHARRDDGILASVWNSNYLTGLTGLPVFIGHGHQTPNWEEAQTAFTQFVSGSWTPEQEQAFLAGRQIRFLVIERGEPTIALFHPETRPYLRPAFAQGKFTVYRFGPPEP